jgi:hypothetical protein
MVLGGTAVADVDRMPQGGDVDRYLQAHFESLREWNLATLPSLRVTALLMLIHPLLNQTPASIRTTSIRSYSHHMNCERSFPLSHQDGSKCVEDDQLT